MKLQIIENRRVWYSFSIILFAASLGFIAFFGLRLGIDFTEGSFIEWSFPVERPAVSDVKILVEASGLSGSIVQELGEHNIIIRSKSMSAETHKKLLASLQEKIGKNSFEEVRFETIGPTISKELRIKSVNMIFGVVVAIILYLAFAFRSISKPISSWKYGLIAVIALIHDVTFPAGVFAYLGYSRGVEVDTLFITAMLTVMGFSVHDTIVVFDRIRENISKGVANFSDTVNTSVNETIARSINTSFTTLLVLLAIYFFGGESVRYFSLAMILGIVVGTYSSIFIASPLLVSWYNWQYTRK